MMLGAERLRKRLPNCTRSYCRWRKRLMDCNDFVILQRMRRIHRECWTNLRGCLRPIPIRTARDGAEAVRLAERACALSERRIPALLATLAAAYAEAGDFPRAVAAGEEALSEARSLSDTDGIKLSENILASVRANVPYRHEPEQ